MFGATNKSQSRVYSKGSMHNFPLHSQGSQSIKSLVIPEERSQESSVISLDLATYDTIDNHQNVANSDEPNVTRETNLQESDCSTLIATQEQDGEQEETHESLVVSINPIIFDTTEESQSKAGSNPFNDFVLGTNLLTRKKTKVYPKNLPYHKIMSHVNFVMSGYENPRRAKLRDLALSMGAKYSAKWNRHCTHLICAFKNTPKYKEVFSRNGRVVREHWIKECSHQKRLLDWRLFKLGDYSHSDSEEEDRDDDLDYALESAYGRRLTLLL